MLSERWRFPYKGRNKENWEEGEMIKLPVPKTIPLASRRYRIILKSLRDENWLGTISHNQNLVIEIDPVQGPTGRATSLWHEIFHGIDKIWQLKLSEDNIGSLAEGLNQVLQDGFRIELDWAGIPKVK